MEITRAIDKLINDEVFYEDKSLKSKRNFSKFEINNMKNQYKKSLTILKLNRFLEKNRYPKKYCLIISIFYFK